jgi:hypothetical protein
MQPSEYVHSHLQAPLNYEPLKILSLYEYDIFFRVYTHTHIYIKHTHKGGCNTHMADMSFSEMLFPLSHGVGASNDTPATSRFSLWQGQKDQREQPQLLPQGSQHSQQHQGSGFLNARGNNGSSLFAGHQSGGFELEQGLGYFGTGRSAVAGSHDMTTLDPLGSRELSYRPLDKDVTGMHNGSLSKDALDMSGVATGTTLPGMQVVAQLVAETPLKEVDLDHKHLALCSGLNREVRAHSVPHASYNRVHDAVDTSDLSYFMR